MQKFIDDDIQHKEDDLEKIRTRPGMYISYRGPRGSMHLSKELINNMIDECGNPNSPGDTVDVFLDEIENTLFSSDNGRGIPFDKMEVVCTKIQSSSKFTRSGTGATAGENGVGLTAVNALSDLFEIVSRRYGEVADIKFSLGKLISPLKIKKGDSDKHGTTFKFRPDPKILGQDCAIPVEGIVEWLDDISYILPEHVKLNLSVTRKGKESSFTKKYRNKGGLYELCKKLIKRPLLDPIHFKKNLKFVEVFDAPPDNIPSVRKTQDGKYEIDRFIGLEVALTFDSSSNTEVVSKSFCNFVSTIDDGVHVDAVRNGIVNYLGKHTRELLSERDVKNLDIIPADITNGLVMTVYLSTDLDPGFSGQTKEKLTNNLFFKPLRDMTYQALREFFKKNPKELKAVTDYIKANARARINAAKERNATIKGETTNLDEHKMANFTPANKRGKDDYRELFIIEGDSAAGSAKNKRITDHQALFSMRGVPKNAFGLALSKVLENTELRDLVKVLKTNIGDRFDIKKCHYKKIIIMTDGDVDGSRIFSLLCAFFVYHMPQLVEEGYVYKAVAPLYLINDKQKPFILNMLEYIQVFERRIGDNIRLIDKDTNVVLSKKDLESFLLNNRTYLEELHRLASYYSIHWEIAELLTIFFATGGTIETSLGRTSLIRTIRKLSPELTMDESNVISGIHEGKYQIITLDSNFMKRIQNLIQLIREQNGGKAHYIVYEKSGKDYENRGIQTIGSFLTMCQKFQPIIETRYKGLGELDPVQLFQTTLNPNNRMLIKLTIDDMEEVLRTFRILHGNLDEERKSLMEHFKIAREDLDN